ncbi:Fkbp3 protein [Geranomyces variabilis]|nr:Fkbp3 protein [Geranomyces variabilis]KAJ3138888.1 FK506-binding protein 2B [Geranomyces variabilis]
MAPAPKWNNEELESDSVSKKDLVSALQDLATYEFLKERKLHGKAANVIKATKKPELIKAYKALHEQDSAFRPEGQSFEEATAQATAAAAATTAAPSESAAPAKEEAVVEEPKYKKVITKKGDGRLPKKGDMVYVFYTGTYLVDGQPKVFDTNMKGAKPSALRFKVGTGKVIKGWDEALLTMTKGEKARIIIESDWAYGKKGVEGKIPPNTDLTFEVHLSQID